MDPASRFEEQGYLVIDRLFDPGLIDAVREEYERQFGDLAEGKLPPHLNVGDRRLQLPILLQGPLLDPKLSAHPLLMRMLETVLGRDFLIDNATIVVALPGARDQSLHRDHHELFPGAAESGEGLGAYAITVSIPLIDLTTETGSTKLYSGSHRSERQVTALRERWARSKLPTLRGAAATLWTIGCGTMAQRTDLPHRARSSTWSTRAPGSPTCSTLRAFQGCRWRVMIWRKCQWLSGACFGD